MHIWYCNGCKEVGNIPAVEGEANALDTLARMSGAHRKKSPECTEQSVSWLSGWLINGFVRELAALN